MGLGGEGNHCSIFFYLISSFQFHLCTFFAFEGVSFFSFELYQFNLAHTKDERALENINRY